MAYSQFQKSKLDRKRSMHTSSNTCQKSWTCLCQPCRSSQATSSEPHCSTTNCVSCCACCSCCSTANCLNCQASCCCQPINCCKCAPCPSTNHLYFGTRLTIVGFIWGLLAAVFGGMHLAYRKTVCSHRAGSAVIVREPTSNTEFSASLDMVVDVPTLPTDCWSNTNNVVFYDPSQVLLYISITCGCIFGSILIAYIIQHWFVEPRFSCKCGGDSDCRLDKTSQKVLLVSWVVIILVVALVPGAITTGLRRIYSVQGSCDGRFRRTIDSTGGTGIDNNGLNHWEAYFTSPLMQDPRKTSLNDRNWFSVEFSSPLSISATSCWLDTRDDFLSFNDPIWVERLFYVVLFGSMLLLFFFQAWCCGVPCCSNEEPMSVEQRTRSQEEELRRAYGPHAVHGILRADRILGEVQQSSRPKRSEQSRPRFQDQQQQQNNSHSDPLGPVGPSKVNIVICPTAPAAPPTSATNLAFAGQLDHLSPPPPYS